MYRVLTRALGIQPLSQAKQMPHVISDTGGRNYVWGDIIQLRITTR